MVETGLWSPATVLPRILLRFFVSFDFTLHVFHVLILLMPSAQWGVKGWASELGCGGCPRLKNKVLLVNIVDSVITSIFTF